MKALTFMQYAKPLALKTVPIRKPAPNEVLVKVRASPINPSDLGFIHGVYGVRRPSIFPVVPGLEGTGTVTEVGSTGNKSWLGKHVSFFIDSQRST